MNFIESEQSCHTRAASLLRSVSIAIACAAIGAVPVLASPASSDLPSSESAWPFYNGSYAGTRYSSLTQINSANVGSLHETGRYTLPETTSFQAEPIIAGQSLYVTTATSTYAVNAATGRLLWEQHYTPKSMGLGTGVRGAAYLDGRLYRGTPDGHLLSLNANSGHIVWDVVAFDAAKGEYIAAAPIAWEGKVYIGNGGSDVGAIGHVRAFAAKDGRLVWNFDKVPASGPGADSWPADPTRVRTGGGMYTSFALDPVTGVIYAPSGNPGPDFAGDYRPGKNLYTSSVVQLDARTGELRNFHQFVEHDVHDWDVAASPMLYTSKGGQNLVAVGGKDGYLYGLDRSLSTVNFRVAVTTRDNVDAALTAAGTRFCPGTQGGINWYGPAYSPRRNALYVGSIDWCTVIKADKGEIPVHKYGAPFLGSRNAFGDSDPNVRSGWVYAVDADSGSVLWSYHAALPMVSGITPTAGGVVFAGTLEGDLLAFDDATGKILLKTRTAGPIGGGIATYSVNGKQYVAVASGMKNAIMKSDSGPATVIIYSLP